jgi:DNA-binding beta-propeller fold protein YncE
MDPVARRLYIAHGHAVQVVDVDSGTVVGEISGFREAHAIALDDTGQYGYVSDGPAAAVKVIDLRSFTVEATISIGCSPRSIAFERQNKLVFAVCGARLVSPGGPPQSVVVRPESLPRMTPPRQPNYAGPSHILVIDAEKNSAIADIILDGDFRFTQPDADGHVYITVGAANEPRTNSSGHVNLEFIPPQIAKIDAAGIPDEVRRHREGKADSASGEPIALDWSNHRNSTGLLHLLPLPGSCDHPEGLAVDTKDQRLFLACDSQQLLVLNSANGQVVATLATGPGDDVIGYDADRGLIYSANGSGYGSLTIIQQDANTDSYAVIQNLPTLARARTLAVDPSTGLVYLVTDLHGVDLTKMGGIGTLHFDPVAGSFQVMVVGH